VNLDQPKIDLTIRQFAFSGQAIAIEVPKDVRLVVSPSPGSRFYGTLVHELGHAYAGTRTRPDHVLYAGHEWVPGLSDPGFAEGLAEFFGRLLDEPRVLKDFLGLNDDEATRLIQARRADGLIRLGRLLSSIAFERSALERPDANLDQLSLEPKVFFATVCHDPRDPAGLDGHWWDGADVQLRERFARRRRPMYFRHHSRWFDSRRLHHLSGRGRWGFGIPHNEVADSGP
jgi:hypothetical protein